MRVTKFDQRQEPAVGQVIGVWPPGSDSEKVIARKFARLTRSLVLQP